MEQAFEGIADLLRAMLGLLLIVGPGMLFWLVVAGVVMAVRWAGQHGPFHRVSHESQTASSPSTVKN